VQLVVREDMCAGLGEAESGVADGRARTGEEHDLDASPRASNECLDDGVVGSEAVACDDDSPLCSLDQVEGGVADLLVGPRGNDDRSRVAGIAGPSRWILDDGEAPLLDQLALRLGPEGPREPRGEALRGLRRQLDAELDVVADGVVEVGGGHDAARRSRGVGDEELGVEVFRRAQEDAADQAVEQGLVLLDHAGVEFVVLGRQLGQAGLGRRQDIDAHAAIGGAQQRVGEVPVRE
jgi:hypothetical protein